MPIPAFDPMSTPPPRPIPQPDPALFAMPQGQVDVASLPGPVRQMSPLMPPGGNPFASAAGPIGAPMSPAAPAAPLVPPLGLGQFGKIEQGAEIPTDYQVTTRISPVPEPQRKEIQQQYQAGMKKEEKALLDLQGLQLEMQQTLEKDPEFKAAMEAIGPTMKAAIDEGANTETLMKEMLGKQKEIRASIERASRPIDPNRFWNSKSNANKAFTLIGIALSGMGRAATGGRNVVMEQIDKAVADDVALQSYEREQAIKDANAIGDTYNKELAIRDGIVANRLKNVANYYAFLESKVKNLKLANASKEAQLARDQLEGQLQQRKAETLAKLYEITGNQVSRVEQGKIFDSRNVAAQDPKNRTPFGYATNVEDAKIINAAVADSQSAIDKLNGYYETMAREGVSGLMTGERAGKFEAQFNSMVSVMQKLFNSGVLNQGELEFFRTTIPTRMDLANPAKGIEYVRGWTNEAGKMIQQGLMRSAQARIPALYNSGYKAPGESATFGGK